jgi:hypothetical protein
MSYVCHDLTMPARGGLELIFPGFSGPDESLAVISPHDDDGLLGAGYLILAAREAGAKVHVLIVCDGRGGYSRIEDKAGISERRKREAVAAYADLGVPADHLVWLDVPDFSVIHYLGWVLPNGQPGLFARFLPLLRSWRVSRLIIPNAHREHIDHSAAHFAGAFYGPQVGDAVLADWGAAPPVKSTLIYSVWADFPPTRPGLAADRALIAPEEIEDRVMAALRRFESQAEVIAGLVAARAGRRRGGRVMELYLTIDPRPRLDYGPYWHEVEKRSQD